MNENGGFGMTAPQPAELARWLSKVEKRMEAEFRQLNAKLDATADGVRSEVRSLAYVDRREFDNYKLDQDKEHGETRAIANQAKAFSVAVLLTMASIIIAGAVGILVATAG